MERLIRGADVRNEETFFGKCICEVSMVVRRNHFECGDSAFAYCDGEKLIVAVFDGVSGEPGAAMASSDAAQAMLEHLKTAKKADEEALKEAFTKAHLAINLGATTVSIAIVEKDGSFILAGIGDSPIYSIDRGKASLELPPARAVGEGDSILKFFHFRTIVTSVLGGAGEISIRICSGKLEKGHTLILATDGLSDNLFMVAKEGYISDCSGAGDLQEILRGKKAPKAMVSSLMDELGKRIQGGRAEGKAGILVPKKDDIAIIALRIA